MARGALLAALMFVLGWHRRRWKVETAFRWGDAGGGSLRWHGTATPPLARAWQARSGLLQASSIFSRQAAGSQRS
jgi:hypothetical protein